MRNKPRNKSIGYIVRKLIIYSLVGLTFAYDTENWISNSIIVALAIYVLMELYLAWTFWRDEEWEKREQWPFGDHLKYYDNGVKKYRWGEYKGAISDFDIAIGIDPEHARSYYYRGLAKARRGNKDGACQDWRRALELGHDGAYEAIGRECA